MKKIIYIVMLLAFASSVSGQWSEQNSGVTTALYSVSAVDDNVVWICGAGGKVLLTTNGGANWDLKTSPNASLDLYNIWGVNNLDAYVTGSGSTTYVYRTSNGGQSWTQVFSQVGGFINAIHGVSLNEPKQMMMYGDPVGGRWSIWINQPGDTWDSTGLYVPQSGTETGFNNAMFAIRGSYDVTKIWFGTNNTKLYKWKSTTGFVPQTTTGQVNTLSIMFADSLLGVMGGSSGMLSTTNGGSNWLPFSVIGTGSINGIVFGYNIGEIYYTRGSSVYYSSNSGTNWVTATTQSGTYQHMIRSRSEPRNNFWAIRNNGGISKYTKPIGIKSISSEVPSAFSLHQNYPNPFNPATIIKFDVQRSANISIKVYDILGREIAALVNELLKPGTYEVDWDGSGFTSGVYFYTMRTGSYTETKKMLMIK